MAGTCSTSLKVIGITSLGLLGGSLSFQGAKGIPELIRNINSRSLPVDVQESARKIHIGGAVSVVLSALASAALLLIYRAAPVTEKHPYLIYSALSAPISVGVSLYMSWKQQKRVVCGARGQKRAQEVMKASAKAAQTQKSGSKDDLGNSYIHVSDEDSSSLSTPSSTAPGSPDTVAAAKDLEQELSIEEEVEQALRKKEHVHDLRTIATALVYGSGVAFFGFALGLVGIVGDIYFNV